jgi:hypothetical protein
MPGDKFELCFEINIERKRERDIESERHAENLLIEIRRIYPEQLRKLPLEEQKLPRVKLLQSQILCYREIKNNFHCLNYAFSNQKTKRV